MSAPQRKRPWYVKLGGGLTVSVVLLLVIEIGLRVIGYGGPGTTLYEDRLLPVPLNWAVEPDLVDEGFFHRELGSDFPVTTNSHGLRADELRPREGDAPLRILTLGDSTTFGWGVANDETYAAYLEQRIREAYPGRDVQVINGGQPGYTCHQGLYLLERTQLVPQMDVLLFTYLLNDARETDRSDKEREEDPEGSAAVAEIQTGFLHKVRLYLWLRNGIHKSQRYYDENLRKSRFGFWAAKNQLAGTLRVPVEDYETNLRTYFDLCAEHGVTMALGGVPEWPDFRYHTVAHRAEMAAIADAEGLVYSDPYPRFDAAREKASGPLIFPEDTGHLTPEGNEVWGDILFEDLKAGGVLDAPTKGADDVPDPAAPQAPTAAEATGTMGGGGPGPGGPGGPGPGPGGPGPGGPGGPGDPGPGPGGVAPPPHGGVAPPPGDGVPPPPEGAAPPGAPNPAPGP